jgi:hypothetical protein
LSSLDRGSTEPLVLAVIGAMLDAHVLAEGHVMRRGIGAAAMVLGVLTLALS